MPAPAKARPVAKQYPDIPTFFLYGEPARDVSDHFLHVEDLDDRTRPGAWNIRPHSHDGLNHLFLVQAGGGHMQAEDRLLAFAAPALLLVPARCVHGFTWRPESRGRVLTIADTYLTEVAAAEPGFRRLFEEARAIAMAPSTREAVENIFARLTRELAWFAPGHAAVIEAQFVMLLVETLRLDQHLRTQDHVRGPRAEIVARFRQAIEAGIHKGWRVTDYARHLNVSVSMLRSACLKVARKPPLRLIEERLLLEAKRLLLYSDMTITETAYSLGFDDPAYFSRVFSRNVRQSPRAFRERRQHFHANGGVQSAR